jgi:hypothetical protein
MVCDNVSVVARLGSPAILLIIELSKGTRFQPEHFHPNTFKQFSLLLFPDVSRLLLSELHSHSFFFKPASQGDYSMGREDEKGRNARLVRFKMSFDVRYRIEDSS